MIRDITLGQYYPAKSVIHRLDPRVKLAGTVLFIIGLFMADNIFAYAFITICLVALIAVSRVPFKFMVKGLKAILVILIFTACLNLFLTPGTEIVRWHVFKITKEGVILTVKMAVRLVFLIIGSSLMTLTTTPNHLTDGLEKAMKPLKKVHVPVHEIAMMMSIALRFIPILMEETDKIIKAQQARCADFESGNLMRRAKALIPILVPLFISSFRRANDLALAMEARCYRGDVGRTKMKPLKYQGRDMAGYLILLVFILGIVALNIFCGTIITL